MLGFQFPILLLILSPVDKAICGTQIPKILVVGRQPFGHIFPLRARSRGVLRRSGHTEAAVDLARMAGLIPAGVLIEIMNDDGTMSRLPELIKLAERFDLKIVSIKDLILNKFILILFKTS